PIVIRDAEGDARAAFEGILRHNGLTKIDGVPVLAGPPAAIARELRPYLELGFSHVIARLPAPYDRETIDRIGELRAALADFPVTA
ncbi:MAG TPA: hypothetical protein VF323_05580, partial [Candidatus Limnocylindrales bacterium]